MDRARGSLSTNFPIHEAATKGDYIAARSALESGADINALDHTGKTVIACAVAGEDWENLNASNASLASKNRLKLLKTLLSHPRISLFTLNFPQNALRGVTPLGMAAWLNVPEVVCTLLQDSMDAVSVDGMDNYGATALMYAARDGSLAVVQHLLSHGARPDFRDMNHRTPIQYSLPHPQVLWLCEAVLRHHRWRENQNGNLRKLFATASNSTKVAWKVMTTSLVSPPILFAPPETTLTHELTSSATQTITKHILSSDLPSLLSLLSESHTSNPSHCAVSALLLNLPDRYGWSPIHHCVSVCPPSVHVLDALYSAGSDMSLFTTTEQHTPLHVLALSTREPTGLTSAKYGSLLREFATHLIRDLQAPLSARDREDETCIHIAAEKGVHLDLLIAFLECDSTGEVRQLRNSRGLTAYEVAKPGFRAAFGIHRTVSSISMSTIRPRSSMASVSSALKTWTPALIPPKELPSFPADFDVSTSIQNLLYNFRVTSPSLHKVTDNYLSLLDTIEDLSHQIFTHFRSVVEQAQEELTDARVGLGSALRELGATKKKVKDELDRKGLVPLARNEYGGRRSGDSQATAVSLPSETCDFGRLTTVDPGSAGTSVSNTEPRHRSESPRSRFIHWPGWLDHFLPDSPLFKSHFPNHLATDAARHDKDTSSISKSLIKKDTSLLSGTVKLTTWLKRKVMPEQLMGQETSIRRKGKDSTPGSPGSSSTSSQSGGIVPVGADDAIEKVLRTAHITMGAANRDLSSIKDVMAVADEYIKSAHRSLSQAERVVQRALKKRRSARRNGPPDLFSINHTSIPPIARLGQGAVSPVEAFGYPPSRPSSSGHVSTSSTLSSARSSSTSVASTLGDFDDRDAKMLRRLLLRKVESQLGEAFDEIDKTTAWLQIVNEVVRGVKRRAYI